MTCKLFTVLFIVGALIGCGQTTQGDFARSTVAEKGAEVMDAGVSNCVWSLCNGFSVGSIKRAFGSPPELAEVYHALCLMQGQRELTAHELFRPEQ